MFSIFSRKPTAVEEMKQAKTAYEKVIALKSDSWESRTLRMRMGMLCRAHLDKAFVNGAEQTAQWQELAALAVADGKPVPELPAASNFVKIKSGAGEVYSYLPEEFSQEAFALGCRYQRTEISAPKAIDAMQALANQISFYELRLEEPFQALTFLREELQAQAEAEARMEQAQQEAAAAAAPPPAPRD